MKIKYIVSFSGGETSGYMAYLMKKNHSDESVFIFANTGQEDERTLIFVDRCDKEFKLNLVWLEADVSSERGVGTSYRVVDFDSASRNGNPFEKVIEKYGIPNQAYPHCTRELKLAPMRKWQKENNLEFAKMCVGIRIDEIDRLSADRESARLFYPLVQRWASSKVDVKDFWAAQSFNLGLSEHEGNCIWCWKKTDRKLLTIMAERPEVFDFPQRMELEHGLAGHNVDGNKRVFFRRNRSVNDLKKLLKENPNFERFKESKPFKQMELIDFDISNGCSESCEVY